MSFNRWKEKYLTFRKKEEEFKLYSRESKPTRSFPPEVEEFLHQQLHYITRCEGRFKNKFNFSFLAEEAEKRFGRPFARNSIRRFALRHNYYHQDSKEKKKVRIRFETPGPGFLFQHDSSHHIPLPLTNSYSDLILTKDNYSRKVVGRKLVKRETSFDHLSVVRKTVEDYGLPLAYYVDEHSIFRFVKHNVVKISEAEKILDELICFYNERHRHEETGEIPNERWKKGIKEKKSRLRILSEEIDLDYVFSLHYQRKVKKDGTISFGGERRKVGKFPKDMVTVCLVPGKKIMIFKDKQKLWEYHL